MEEPDLARVQVEPFQRGKPRRHGGSPIKAVSDNRMADLRQVDPDLMSPPGCDSHFEQRVACRLLEDAKIGLGGASLGARRIRFRTFATSNTPLVMRSRRWTIPGRNSPPTVESVEK